MSTLTLDLAGQWQFKQYPTSARRMRDLDTADWYTATIPNSIFINLIEAGQIDQVEMHSCPEKFNWISEEPWVFKKIFDAPPEFFDCDRRELVFDGLDTIASIWLNDKLIGKTDNMFIPFRIDVTEHLKSKNNTLIVKLEPTEKYAKNLMQRYTIFDESTIISPHRAYIRKAQYQFGWDFCPKMPGCGIWRTVRLEGIKTVRISELHIQTVECSDLYADVKIAVKLNTVTKEKFTCKLALKNADQKIEQKLPFTPGQDFHLTVIHIKNPKLWWPAGYGQPNLYNLQIQLANDNEIIDKAEKDFGIRTIKLNRQADRYGEKFQFEINDQPVFVKGANWIPASIFPGSVTIEKYHDLITAAANANINMLRVWGGGYYESEQFYQLCDKFGIMVWQVFMFACSYYPDRKWFLKKIEKEATQIIKQLRNHPSLTLWCGNNEIDQMHKEGKFGKGKKFYGKTIYHDILPKLIAELDSTTAYIPTTPFSDTHTPNDTTSGTFHQWQVWSQYQPVRNYRPAEEETPRFVTEFGMQSLPSVETIKKSCTPERLQVSSELIEKYDYQLDGINRLQRYISELFGNARTVEQFVHLSQVTQARAIKTYVEHLRVNSQINSGAIFWQFNDCCPAISWSAIDYYGHPKALYYYAKRFFEKLTVTFLPKFENTKANTPPMLRVMHAAVINDCPQPLTAILNCKLIDLFGKCIDQLTLPLSIGPFSTSLPIKLPKAFDVPKEPEKSALHIVVEKHGKKKAENLFLYLPDKYIKWPRAKIEKKMEQTDEKQWNLTLKANAIVKDLHIAIAGSTPFSDNFIDLIPPDEKTIAIQCTKQQLPIETNMIFYPFDDSIASS